MNYIVMSDEAYKELKDFLDESKVESYNIRIHISDYSCSGPVFNLAVDEAGEGDVKETFNEITFCMEQVIADTFGGFMFVSNSENNGYGIGMKPLIAPQSGCGGCSGGCGEGNGCGDGGCCGE